MDQQFNTWASKWGRFLIFLTDLMLINDPKIKIGIALKGGKGRIFFYCILTLVTHRCNFMHLIQVNLTLASGQKFSFCMVFTETST